MSNTSLLGSYGGQTGDALMFRNRIINGDMRIDQRRAGSAISIGPEEYTVDRWKAEGSQNNKFSIQQSAIAPVGFTNSLAVTSSSAYSVTAGDFFGIFQPIEGFNVADLAWGTANAQSVTISFWVRSSLTGLFGGALENASNNRSYAFSYTISAANTWEYKTVTIPGDTTGTWDKTNGRGITLRFSLGVGSTYSGAAGTWGSTRYFAPTGATSVVGTNGATFYLTGVQLEAGPTATPFERRPIGVELALCQRYYARLTAGTGAYTTFANGFQSTTTLAKFNIRYPVTMRNIPNFSFFNLAVNDDITFTHSASVGAVFASTTTAGIMASFSPAAGAQHRPVELCAFNTTNAYLEINAEL